MVTAVSNTSILQEMASFRERALLIHIIRAHVHTQSIQVQRTSIIYARVRTYVRTRSISRVIAS